MKRKNNLLVDIHLSSLIEMKEPETDAYFYTRLRARMERQNGVTEWNFPLKPIWIIGTMSLLLLINVLMINLKNKTTTIQTEDTHSIKNFAASYDQIISSF